MVAECGAAGSVFRHGGHGIGGCGTRPASAPAVPHSAVAPVLGDAQAAANAAPDPSFLSQQVHPDVLALSVRRVIVDAGHGGDNLGTSTADGINEKDVTLDIAERVRELIVQRGIEAVMTRTADETRSLQERAATANRRHGDMFVSIHLNSLRPSGARGSETVYLAPSDGPEFDAMRPRRTGTRVLSLGHPVVARKNLHGPPDGTSRGGWPNRSARARSDFRKTSPAITDRGVKTAPLVVLVAGEARNGTEVSGLSNEDDARRLNTAEYRQTIAEGTASGIQTLPMGHV